METPATGVIEVTVKLRLEMDVDKEDAREIVENLDYSFRHPLIQDTEITGDDIEQRIADSQADIDFENANGG
jgi:hypothetical protein